MKTICILIVFFSTVAFTQNNSIMQGDTGSESINQLNEFPRHSIDLSVSFWNNSQSAVSVGYQGVSVETGNGAISGSLMYNYYPNSGYSFNVSVGVLSTEVRVENFSNYTSIIIPIMLGMKYYLIDYSPDNPFRPYIAGSIGGLYGTESTVGIANVRYHNETAFGVSGGIGSDIILGSLIKLHAGIGYNLFTDFKEEIGSRKNYSGPEFSCGLGFMF